VLRLGLCWWLSGALAHDLASGGVWARLAFHVERSAEQHRAASTINRWISPFLLKFGAFLADLGRSWLIIDDHRR
jgi:hypothetical protein